MEGLNQDPEIQNLVMQEQIEKNVKKYENNSRNLFLRICALRFNV